MPFIIDSYPESNIGTFNLGIGTSNREGGQSFTCSKNCFLYSAKFYLKKLTAFEPAGNMFARLYSHTGTYGTSSLPGTLLATSDNVSVSVLSVNDTYYLVEFIFSGSNYISLSTNTYYVISLARDSTTGSVYMGTDYLSPTASGNDYIRDSVDTLTARTTEDIIFYVYGETSLLTDLVSYWKLDESSGNAADSVGSNTGTNSNVTYAAAKINNGGVFNGSSAELNIGTTSSLKTSSFSISTWINGDTFATNGRFIFCNQIHGNYYGWNLNIGTDSKVYLSLQSSAATKHIGSVATLSTGMWYHLVATYDGTTGKIYINGTENKSEASGLTLAYEAGAEVMIGNRDGSTVNWFDGIIDEVGIWSRALSSTEVTELYNSGNGKQYPFVGNTPAFLLNFI